METKIRGFFVFLGKTLRMKKVCVSLVVFLLVLSGYLIFNCRQKSIKEHQLQKELKETNEGYDNNIQYAIHLEDSIKNLKHTIDSLHQKDRFSLAGNPKAMIYLNKAFETEKKWPAYLKKLLLETNEKQKGDNPLIPFAGMAGKMHFDDVKVLNHRWIIAHFTDGTYQGSLILRYDIDQNGQVKFKVLDQTLYQ